MTKKFNKSILVLVLLLVVAFGLLGLNNIFSLSNSSNPSNPSGSSSANSSDEPVPCSNPILPAPPAYHIHPHLQLIINGQNVLIPANIGISLTCERVVHTHDETGTIHIEPNNYQEFKLGDFFWVWGQPFSKNQILNYTFDAGHQITMTVDGQPSEEYENLILRNKQEIVIEYKNK